MGYTLPEFAKTVKDPFRAGIIETIYTVRPFLQYVQWNTIAGLAYSYSQNTALPGVTFRKLNAAWTASAGITNRQVEPLKILGGESDTDIELVKAYGISQRTARDQLFLTAMSLTYVQYFFYGNCGARAVGSPYENTDGFDGMITRLSAAQTVDATGTSSTVGSSVFVIKFGDPYCQGIQSHDIEATDLGEISSAPVYRTRVGWAPGVAIMHGMSVSRIKNLDTAKPLTCDLLDEAIDRIVGEPTVIVMSKRSRRQLKTSAKTAGVALGLTMNALGKAVSTWGDVPIVADDAIIDTENNGV